MAYNERYRIIHYPKEGALKVRNIKGLLTKANNIYNGFGEMPGKTTFERLDASTGKWIMVKSREKP